MRGKSAKRFIFFATAAVVVGYAIYDYKSSEIRSDHQDKQSLVLPVMADQIHILIFEKGPSAKNSQAIELEHDKEGWKLVRPVQDRANSNIVDEFLEGLAAEKVKDVVVEGDKTDLTNFGLDQPLGKLTVIANSGERTQFSIGQRKNFQGDAFLQKNSEKKVSVVSSTWFEKINKTSLDFRDKRLMRTSNAGTEKIRILQALGARRERIELQKKDSIWTLQDQPKWHLDQNKVRELLSMLNTTDALEFIAEGDAVPAEISKWGLNHPRTQISVQSKDGKVWKADIAAGPDKVHRIRTNDPHLILKISPTDSDKFFQVSRDSFRDRSEPFDFDKNRVQKIEFSIGGKKTEISASSEMGSALISKLKSLSIIDFQNSSLAPLKNEIFLKDKSDQLVFRLQWSELPDSKSNPAQTVSAMTSVYPSRFNLSSEDIHNLKLSEISSAANGKGSSK